MQVTAHPEAFNGAGKLRNGCRLRIGHIKPQNIVTLPAGHEIDDVALSASGRGMFGSQDKYIIATLPVAVYEPDSTAC